VHELPGGGGSGGGGGAGGESVGDAILRAAEELDAAALVMLSHEKTKLEQFIWGSVSKEVASRTKRPVVLVHWVSGEERVERERVEREGENERGSWERKL